MMKQDRSHYIRFLKRRSIQFVFIELASLNYFIAKYNFRKSEDEGENIRKIGF